MKTKNAQTLGVHLDNDIVAMIERRAKVRGVSKSRYAAMVFEKWKEEKFPALDTVDGTARVVVLQQLKEETSAWRDIEDKETREEASQLKRHVQKAGLPIGHVKQPRKKKAA